MYVPKNMGEEVSWQGAPYTVQTDKDGRRYVEVGIAAVSDLYWHGLRTEEQLREDEYKVIRAKETAKAIKAQLELEDPDTNAYRSIKRQLVGAEAQVKAAQEALSAFEDTESVDEAGQEERPRSKLKIRSRG
jgi:hypothetical protein